MGIMIRYTLLGGLNSTTMANANVTVDEWMELDTSVGQVEWVEVLTSKLSNCNYKSILLGLQCFVSAVVDAVEANGCRSGKTPTLLGAFEIRLRKSLIEFKKNAGTLPLNSS